MRAILKPRSVCAFFSLLLLCSCASTRDPAAFAPAVELPATVALNEGAGRGGYLTVTLRLESGEKFVMLVDTGTPITFLPKSLEPKLGKRLGTETFSDFGHKEKVGLYVAPRLFFGNTLLMTGNRVAVGNDMVGILGMDCLRHYCLQLDFQAGKLRFLDPGKANTTDLGKAFPLTGFNYAYIHQSGLFQETSAEVLVDTGHPLDGMLPSRLFQKEVREQHTQPISLAKNGIVTGAAPGIVSFSKCVWAGNTYTNLMIGKGQPTLIGLGFLARHLVTFDFPKRIMYLKQTSVGPLVDEKFAAALNFITDLKKANQIPGWLKTDHGTINFESHSDTETFGFAASKQGDSSVYHYTVARASKDTHWKLQKAWRTDQTGHTIEEYPLP